MFDLKSGSEVKAEVNFKRSVGYNRYFCASAHRQTSIHCIVFTRMEVIQILIQMGIMKKAAVVVKQHNQTTPSSGTDVCRCLIELKQTAVWIHLSLTHSMCSRLTGQEVMLLMPMNDIFIYQRKWPCQCTLSD